MLPVRTELVVETALFLVFQNFVSLVDILELSLGFFVAGVQVRVVFARQLFERLGDLVFGGAARHAQKFVIVLVFNGHLV